MPAGRPSTYESRFAEQAAKLCSLGATDPDLCDLFKCSRSTLNLWKIEHPDFSDAIKQAKADWDDAVEVSLLRRARGYTRKVTKVFQYEGEPVETQIDEEVPPDPASMIFWLKNRQPARWRDRIEHTGADGGPMQLEVVHSVVALDAVFGEVIENDSAAETLAIEPPRGDRKRDKPHRRERKDKQNNKLRSKLGG